VQVATPHLARSCNVQLLDSQAARTREAIRVVRSTAVLPGASSASTSSAANNARVRSVHRAPVRSIDGALASSTWATVQETAPIGTVAPQVPSRAMVDNELSKHCEPLVPLMDSVRMVLPERTSSVRMPSRMGSVRMPERSYSVRVPPKESQPAAEVTPLDNCSGAVRQAVAPVPYTGICYVPLPQCGPPPDPAALEEMACGSFAEGEVAGAAKLDLERHGYQLTPSDVQAHQTSSDGVVVSNEQCWQGEFRPTTAVAAVADEHAGSDQFTRILSTLEMYLAGTANAHANETDLANPVMPAARNSMPMKQPIALANADDDGLLSHHGVEGEVSFCCDSQPPSGSGVDDWNATATRVPQCNEGAGTALPDRGRDVRSCADACPPDADPPDALAHSLSATALAPPAAPKLVAACSVQPTSVLDVAEEIDTDSTKRLARENALLRSQFQNQRECIAKLMSQVEGMRNQIRELSCERSVDCSDGSDSNMMQRQRSLGKLCKIQEGDSDSGMTEAAAVRGNSPGRSRMSNSISSPVGEGREGSIDEDLKLQPDQVVETMHTLDADREQRQSQFISGHEHQKSSGVSWVEERKHLMSELEKIRLSAERRAVLIGSTGGSDSVQGATPIQRSVPLEPQAVDRFAEVSTPLTTPELPATALSEGYGAAAKAMVEAKSAAVAPCVTPPFCKSLIGANIQISTDGYVARRTRGCRQSVVIGSAPLERQEQGWYFEVHVRETVSGWVGGLGIGVTRTPPSELRRMPDKAWRIPSTFISGYWGCVFLDGRERRTKWKADSLTAGSRVGLLVTGDGRGDLIVFADGRPVVRAEDVLATGSPVHGKRVDTLYPVIDVFAATLEVEMLPSAEVPPKPWTSTPSPPGSPASLGGRSLASSSCASHLFVAPDLRASR